MISLLQNKYVKKNTNECATNIKGIPESKGNFESPLIEQKLNERPQTSKV